MSAPRSPWTGTVVQIESSTESASSNLPVLSTRTRGVRLVASWVLVAIGVPLLIRAELGVSPFDVFNTGVSAATGWSFGRCFVVNSVALFLAGRLLGARLGWASLAGTLVIGPAVDAVLTAIPDQDLLAIRVPLLLLGIAIIAVAICMVVSTDLGAGPTEVVMLGLIRRGLGVIPARWTSDGVPVVVGALLGGALGVGTVLFVLTMGPMVKFGLRRMGYEPPQRRIVLAAAGPPA